jgi:hypothetical protein
LACCLAFWSSACCNRSMATFEGVSWSCIPGRA